jgi:hypothetical protein
MPRLVGESDVLSVGSNQRDVDRGKGGLVIAHHVKGLGAPLTSQMNTNGETRRILKVKDKQGT